MDILIGTKTVMIKTLRMAMDAVQLVLPRLVSVVLGTCQQLALRLVEIQLQLVLSNVTMGTLFQMMVVPPVF